MMDHLWTVPVKPGRSVQPLIEMCRCGQLYEAEDWLKAGGPVDGPPHTGGRAPKRSPLCFAVDRGFHSLVRLLLRHGADPEWRKGYPLRKAVRMKRPDLAALLLAHGADGKRVDFREVVDAREGNLIRVFAAHGADLETGKPVARALISRTGAALGIVKDHRATHPCVQDQADIALRHYAYKGDRYWVRLLLRAGADPYSTGPDDPSTKPDPEYDTNAFDLAAMWGHAELFDLQGFVPDPADPRHHELVRLAIIAPSLGTVKALLGLGFGLPPEEEAPGLIEEIVRAMGVSIPFLEKGILRVKSNPKAAMKGLEVLKFLVGERFAWSPTGPGSFRDLRSALYRLPPRDATRVLLLLAVRRAISREALEEIIRTDTMRKHTRRSRAALKRAVDR